MAAQKAKTAGEHDEHEASAPTEKVTLGHDVLEIAINEAIRPFARFLVDKFPEDLVKDQGRLWAMASPALAFAIARVLPDKGVWRSIDTFQKEFLSEVSQAIKDRAAGKVHGATTVALPASAHVTAAEASSFGMVFTILGKTPQGLAILQKIGGYGQDGMILYAHFVGIPAAQLEKQLNGFLADAVDALMLTLMPAKPNHTTALAPVVNSALAIWRTRAGAAAQKFRQKKGIW